MLIKKNKSVIEISQQMSQGGGQKEKIDKYTIYREKYIGKGQFGVVYEASSDDMAELICCKIMKVMKNDIDSQRLAKREMDILKSLKNSENPYLIKIYDVLDNAQSSEIMIFMEYCRGGDFKDDWDRRVKTKQSYSLEEIKKFMKHIILAYRTLYDRNIIHRDIKPANILLLSTGGFKLTDFGMGRIIEDTNKRYPLTKVGTPAYAAPQLYMEPTFSCKCDVYSLGIILYQMTYLELPFKAMTQNDLMIYLRQIKITPLKCKQPKIEGSPQELQLLVKLIEDMLLFDENTRISWPDLFAHPFVSGEVSKISQAPVKPNPVQAPQAQASPQLTQQQQQQQQMQQWQTNQPQQQQQFQGNTFTDDSIFIQKNGVSNNYDLKVFQLKSGMQGATKSERLQHFLNIALAKSMVCQDLLELTLTELPTKILPMINEFYYNLLLTCILGYQNKVLINAFGFAFNHINYIAVKIQQLFDQAHLVEALNQLSDDQSAACMQIKKQIHVNVSSSNDAFLAQENKLIQLFNKYQYKVGIDNFKKLVGLQDKIEYGLYSTWFKFFYENDFKASLPYVKNQAYPFAYIKFVALSEFFIKIELEYPLNTYLSQSPIEIAQIITYDEAKLRQVIEQRRNL